MQLLWYPVVWLSRFRKVIDLLEGQLGDAVWSPQTKPVATTLDSQRLDGRVGDRIDAAGRVRALVGSTPTMTTLNLPTEGAACWSTVADTPT